MSLPFDATVKEVLQEHPTDYAKEFYLPTGQPVTPLNVDLSTLTAATDVAFGYGDPFDEIVDINFQSGCDPFADWRFHLYNAAFGHRFHVPVRSIAVLLRPAADHANLTGKLRYGRGAHRVQFNYKVVRLWLRPVTAYLRGGLGLLPLAPLCALQRGVPVEEALTDVVRRIDQRLRAETDHVEAARLMTAAFVLTGLRVPRAAVSEIYRGVGVMQDSSSYQLILDEGRQEGRVQQAQRILLRQGRRRFGSPGAVVKTALLAVTDLDRLDRLTDAVLTAATWQELLLTP